MDTVGVRGFFASVDVFIASMIEKVYGLILLIADVDIWSKVGNKIFNKVFSLIAVFMLFKAAIIVIQYVINPDELISSKKGGVKFLKNIVISLFMLTMATTVFEKLYQLQGIVLNENVLGRIFLEDSKENATEQSKDFNNIGKEVAYYIFSSFLDYSRDGALAPVFPDYCKNIFVEEDYELNKETYYVSYINPYNGFVINVARPVYTCASYVTHGQNVGMSNLVYDSRIDSRFNRLDDGTAINWSGSILGSCGSQTGGYYTCKSYLCQSYNCGSKNGVYLVNLINNARENKDVKLMLSDDILSSTESDYIFAPGIMSGSNYSSSLSDSIQICKCYSCFAPYVKDSYDCNTSDGDFIFEYKFGVSSLVGFIILIMIIVLAVDVAIRTVKLAFLEIIAPIPIVSFMDIKESGLFKSWVKLFINVYLELFLKLGSIYFGFFFIKLLMNGSFSDIPAFQNVFGRFFMIFGCLLFGKKFPDFVSQMIGLGGDTGVGSFFKTSLKFVTGAGAMAVAGIGGATSNLASGVEKISSANGTKAKLLQTGKTVASVFGGAGSAAVRTMANQISSKGSGTKNNIMRGIYGSSYARKQNEMGNHIGNRALDSARDLFQINNKEKLSTEDMKKELENIKKEKLENDNMINSLLNNESNATSIRNAFELDDKNNRLYKNYEEYSNNVSNSISEELYNSYDYYYNLRDEHNKRIKELTEEIEHNEANDSYK